MLFGTVIRPQCLQKINERIAPFELSFSALDLQTLELSFDLVLLFCSTVKDSPAVMAGLELRDVASADTIIKPALSQAVGYVVVVVVGFIIATGMVFVTRLMKKTVGEDNSKTEMFMTANRSVRVGLTSSAVVSSWLWSTAMLGSAAVGYSFGAAGPFWFAAGYVCETFSTCPY